MVRPRQFSDQDILIAARRCILRDGPSVSTTVIAQEVGLSQAALFKRFGTKDDLILRALLPAETPSWILHVEKGLDERPVHIQLRDIVQRMSAFYDHMIPCLSMLRARFDPREILSRRPDLPPIRGRAALVHWFRVARREGQIRDVHPEATADALLGALHGRSFLKHVAPPNPFGKDQDAPSVDHLVDILWHGLAPTEEAS